MGFNRVSWIFVLLVGTISCVHGIDIDSVREGPCIQPPADPTFDLSWAVSRAEWFYPIWSKYEVYRWTTSVSGFDARVISPELIDSSCQVLFLSTQTGALHIGFAGTRKTKFESTVTAPGVFDWVEVKDDGSRGYRGKSVVTLTDNKTFYVTVNCWSENARSYLVQSTTKTLDNATKEKIREHLAKLGFDVTNKWYDMPYDNCVGLPALPAAAINAAPTPPAPVNLLASGSEQSYASAQSTRNQSPFNFLSGIFQRKIEFLGRIFQTVIQILTAPIRFITNLIGMAGNNGNNGGLLGGILG